VTLATPDTSAPRAPGSEYGAHTCDHSGAAKLYGERGERCHFPGCRVLLSEYNPGDRCYCHGPCGGVHKRKARKRGSSASADSSAVATAAPAAREQKKEATVPRDEIHNRCEDVLEIMRDGKWWTAAELGERLGVSRQRVHTMTKQLREAGHTIESVSGIGTRLIDEKLRAHSDEGEETAKTAPATPPAPAAPVIPPPEQPANVATAPAPEMPPGPSLVADEYHIRSAADDDALAERLTKAQTFAGEAMTTNFFRPLIGIAKSRELRVITDLEEMEDGERERVLQYAVSRWWLP
jgi:biotin operon repressor